MLINKVKAARGAACADRAFLSRRASGKRRASMRAFAEAIWSSAGPTRLPGNGREAARGKKPARSGELEVREKTWWRWREDTRGKSGTTIHISDMCMCACLCGFVGDGVIRLSRDPELQGFGIG